MNFLIATLVFLLAGCSTFTPKVDIKTIKVPHEIMQDCDDFLIPKDGSFEEFMAKTVDNKKIFELCKTQNKAKKDFINSNF
jgi:hypothetical protein